MEAIEILAVSVYIGLGSNLGVRYENLERALRLLSESFILREVSSVYETQPWGNYDQHRFLNCVSHLETFLNPRETLTVMKDVEQRMGSIHKVRWGPRVIDVDILLFGEETVHEPDFEVPHPLMCQRAFVLVPLAEMVPNLGHPVSGLTIQELVNKVDDKDTVRLVCGPIKI